MGVVTDFGDTPDVLDGLAPGWYLFTVVDYEMGFTRDDAKYPDKEKLDWTLEVAYPEENSGFPIKYTTVIDDSVPMDSLPIQKTKEFFAALGFLDENSRLTIKPPFEEVLDKVVGGFVTLTKREDGSGWNNIRRLRDARQVKDIITPSE